MKTAFTLTPAYGRDYKSKAAVQADIDAGKDFIVAASGKPVNKPQLLEAGFELAPVRYAGLRKIAFFPLTA